MRTALEIKGEGNRFASQKKYQQALQKYNLQKMLPKVINQMIKTDLLIY